MDRSTSSRQWVLPSKSTFKAYPITAQEQEDINIRTSIIQRGIIIFFYCIQIHTRLHGHRDNGGISFGKSLGHSTIAHVHPFGNFHTFIFQATVHCTWTGSFLGAVRCCHPSWWCLAGRGGFTRRQPRALLLPIVLLRQGHSFIHPQQKSIQRVRAGWLKPWEGGCEAAQSALLVQATQHGAGK